MRALPALLLLALMPAVPSQDPITTRSLLLEMVDLDRLARAPDPVYRTVQYSSYDRRSKGPEDPHWYDNADGFGREPVPGFAKVLRAPDAQGVGQYLVCDVDGAGAIVRGWSAGMAGILRVYLDGTEKPLFEGKGYDFFARRTTHLLGERAGDVPEELYDLFVQQDADYLPIPFAKGLRITWEGNLRDLHFYHLQVREYIRRASVVTFAPEQVTAAALSELGDAWAATRAADGEGKVEEFELEPGASWHVESDYAIPFALDRLTVRVESEDTWAALRGSLLRIAFDLCQRPQVEAPLGDFFGSGPGINPLDTVPLTVARDGTMTCRFVMPFRSRCQLEVTNHSGKTVRYRLTHRERPFPGGFGNLFSFRARWRVDHELRAEAGARPTDLPYLVALGEGRLVGLACMIANPLDDPRKRSNWWGEGDEKILVDGEPVPSTFGTGSEDYYNYSWSRWALFDHGYSGQPLDSGPGNCGYVSNHRLQILDDIPFQQSLWCGLELWSHRPVEQLSYGRLAYWYARPGAMDDHRRLQPAELVVPAMPTWVDGVFSKAGEDTCMPVASLHPRVTAGAIAATRHRLTRSGELFDWQAPDSGALRFSVHAAQEGRYRLSLSVAHRPDGATVRVRLGGQILTCEGRKEHPLQADFAERLLDVRFDEVSLKPGDHEVVVECTGTGIVRLDHAHLEMIGRQPLRLPGAVEGEKLRVLGASAGVEYQVQGMPADRWSGGAHLWVRAQKPGAFVELEVPAQGGVKRVQLRLTKSWDYGVLKASWNGKVVVPEVDTYNDGGVGVLPLLEIGDRDLSQPARLRLEVVDSHPDSRPPSCYFGFDCLVLKQP